MKLTKCVSTYMFALVIVANLFLLFRLYAALENTKLELEIMRGHIDNAYGILTAEIMGTQQRVEYLLREAGVSIQGSLENSQVVKLFEGVVKLIEENESYKNTKTAGFLLKLLEGSEWITGKNSSFDKVKDAANKKSET